MAGNLITEEQIFHNYISSLKDQKDLLSGSLFILRWDLNDYSMNYKDDNKFSKLKEDLYNFENANSEANCFNLNSLNEKFGSLYEELYSEVKKHVPDLSLGFDKSYSEEKVFKPFTAVKESEYMKMGQYLSSLSDENNIFTGNPKLLPDCLKSYYSETKKLENESKVYEVDGRTEELYKKYLEKYGKLLNEAYNSYKTSNNRSSSMADQEKSLDPILDQYKEMKKKYPDSILLFRMDNEYKTFRIDAKDSSHILGLPIENVKKGTRSIQTVSFPHHALDMYLPKLVRAGKRVAICEQLENSLKQKTVETITPNHTVNKKDNSLKQNNMAESKNKNSVKEEKPAMRQVNVEGLFNALNKNGEAKLSDHFEPEVKEMKKSAEKTEQTSKSQNAAQDSAIREKRPPQFVTVNGDEVTHGHIFKSNKSDDWFFTARINGEPLKPVGITKEETDGFFNKSLSVQNLMEKYHPSKLMPKVNSNDLAVTHTFQGNNGQTHTVEKFNVYKEKDQSNQDYGKYKFYAVVDGQKMSMTAPKSDLNAFFDKVMTPAQLVVKNFGDRLNLKEHYEQFKLPDGIDISKIHIMKNKETNFYEISANFGEAGKIPGKALSYNDRTSFFANKTATKDQLAAKYLGNEISAILPNLKTAATQKVERQPSLSFH